MDAIKVNTQRVDETVHHVVLNDAQLKALVAKAVSEAAGVSIDGRAVRLKQCYLSSDMTSTGTEYRATCTITVDHQVEPREPSPAPPAPPAPSAPPPRRP